MLASLALSITNMQSLIDNLLQKSDNNTASINELKATNEKANSELNTKIDDFLAKESGLRKEVAPVQTEIKEVKGELKVLIDDKEKREQEKRSLNITIRGVPETRDEERMHETMNLLFRELGCSFPFSMTNGANRLGQNKPPQAKKGKRIITRNIILRLLTTQQKSRDHEVLNEVGFSNDYTDEQMLIHGEVQQVYAAARKLEGVSTQSRSLSIVIDNKVYTKKDFNNLPHGLTLENVSTIETPDGMAFQGHNSPPQQLLQM